MTVFTDDFDRANSSDLGAGWVEVSGDWSIASNRLSPGSAGGTIIARASGAMSTDNNYAQVTIAATGAVSHGIVCRGNSNFSSGYLWRNDGSTWDLFSIVGGSFTNLGTYAAAAAPGDVAKVVANGSTITGSVNGTDRVSVTNTHVTTGTSVGIRSESSAAIAFDDFTGSDVGATVTGTVSVPLGALDVSMSGTRTTFGEMAVPLGALSMVMDGSVQVVPEVGSWWGLVDILAEVRDLDRQAESEVPVVCPYDFTTLQPAPGGKLFCPWAGDYLWPDDGHVD